MGEWLSPQSLTALAALVTALGAAVIAFVRERRQAPIDRDSANVATFTAVSAANKAVADSFLQLSEQQRQEIARLEGAVREERGKVTIWEGWYDKFREHWSTYRTHDLAPNPPSYDKD